MRYQIPSPYLSHSVEQLGILPSWGQSGLGQISVVLGDIQGMAAGCLPQEASKNLSLS